MIPRPRRRSGRRLVAVLVVTATFVAGCSESNGESGATGAAAPTSAEVSDVLAGLAVDAIVPAYDHLGASLDELAAAVDDLCAAPSPAALDEARAAWRTAVEAWQATRAGGVGPAMDVRLRSDVAFAAREGNVDDLLAGDEPVDHDAIADHGAAVRGIYALELAIFGEAAEALATGDDRRCTYAASVAALAAEAAAPVVDAWTSGDAPADLAAGLDDGSTSSVAMLVNEVSFRLTEIDQQGLRDLASAESLDDLAAGRDDGPGDHGIAERRALLAGAVAILGDTDGGIVSLVAETDPDLAERLVAAADRATDALDALPDSVAEAFEDPEALADASDAVAELQVLVATELAAELGVTISFSDSDGDS